mmetsp:Transcript_31753/g.66292  ORF Transcript_31753/g.66292 Transcript_31753/m.66292 type:complete len:246 (+) Transcript_31753:115-852(+)
MLRSLYFTSLLFILQFTSPLLLSNLPTPISAFAASKKPSSKPKSNPKSRASTTKGFGAPPPTLDDLLSSFPNRLPPQHDLDIISCPCRSGLTYKECCRPLHSLERECTSKVDVLRSRYSAFSYRLIEYVMRSTHPTCRDYREDKVAWAKDLNKGGMFDSFEFVDLTIIDDDDENNEGGEDEDGEENGYVTFKVTLRAREDKPMYATVAGQETVITEKSKFIKEKGVWKYASGEVQSDRLENVKLN